MRAGAAGDAAAGLVAVVVAGDFVVAGELEALEGDFVVAGDGDVFAGLWAKPTPAGTAASRAMARIERIGFMECSFLFDG